MSAEVLGILEDHEALGFMPARELLEPQASEVVYATAVAMADLLESGVSYRRGHFLVRLTDGTTVSSYFKFDAR